MTSTGPSKGQAVHHSFCRICNAACGILVTTEDGVVRQVRGDADHPISAGYTCPKGRAAGEFHHDPRRLNEPAVRADGEGRSGELVGCDWDEALDDLAARLEAIIADDGLDAVALYLGTASAFDTNGRNASEAFFAALGSRSRYTCATIDTPAKLLCSELMSGFMGLHPMLDTESSKLLLLFGTNPVVSHGHLNGFTDPVSTFRTLAQQGQVWVIDPRRTETARLASRHLQIRPGTDHVLLAHLVRELLRNGSDREYLDLHASDTETLAEAVEPFDLMTTVGVTSLDAGDVTDLVAAIRSNGRVSSLTGTGTTMGVAANVTEWLSWALQIVTGSFDRPGGMWFNPGFTKRLDTIEKWRHTSGEAEQGPPSRPDLPRRYGEHPCAGLVDEIEAGNVRALLVPGGNLLPAFPDYERTRAALERLDVVVVGDVVDNEMVDVATHIWPCAGQFERADIPILMEIYQLGVGSQYAPAILPLAGERKPMWRPFAQLGRRLGLQVLPGGLDPDTCTDDDLLKPLVANGTADLDTLRAHPSGMLSKKTTFGWVTSRLLPDGGWRMAPRPFVDQLSHIAEPPDLALIPGRQLRTMNSQLRDVAAPGGRTDHVAVHAHPTDADTAGVAHDEAVRVRSRHGELVGILHVNPDVRPGAVWIPHGWMETNVCRLTSRTEDIDPLTGMVRQSGVAVTLTRV